MRWSTLALGLGLAAVAALLTSVSYLPFQDVPNLAAVLTFDRGLTPAAATLLEPHHGHAYGYLAFVWIAELLPRAWSVDVVLRLMCLVSALALPLSVAQLGRAVGGDATLAGVASLPLALSWPLRIGLLPFCLALPCLFAALAATALCLRRVTIARAATLALAATTSYLAHPLALALLLPLVAGGAWIGRRRSWLVVSLLAALTPSLILLCLDLGRDAFAPLGAMQLGSHYPRLYFRPPWLALAHLLTRSFGLDGWRALAGCAPLLAVVLFGAVRAARRPHPFVWLSLTLALVATLALPESIGLAFLLGSRTPVVAVALACVAASRGLAQASPRARLALVASSALALAVGMAHVGAQARVVHEVVGAAAPRTLAGRFLPVRIAECSVAASTAWGADDPLRHAWAYALSPSGVTPYLFAWSRYAPIWYRDELRAPAEFDLDANESPLPPARCRAMSLARVRGALAWPGYDGVIVTGRTATLGPLVADAGAPFALVAPGIALITVAPPAALRLDVDEPTPAFASGWYAPESVDGRRIRWSAGTRSRLEATLAPRDDRPYVFALDAKAVADEVVAIRVNGRAVGSVALGGQRRWRAVVVPARIVHRGVNRIELAYSATQRVGGRMLAIALAAAELAPAPSSLALDVARDEDRRLFDGGWSVLEHEDGRAQVWSDGPASRLRFALAPTDESYELALDVAAYGPALPETVSVRIGGRELGLLAIEAPWQHATMTIPAGVLRPDIQLLELVYSKVARPRDVERGSRDARELALRLRAVTLRPATRASR